MKKDGRREEGKLDGGQKGENEGEEERENAGRRMRIGEKWARRGRGGIGEERLRIRERKKSRLMVRVTETVNWGVKSEEMGD